MNQRASVKQNQCTAGHGNHFRAIYQVELLKFSMIHILQLNSSPIFCILESTNCLHRELSRMPELWQPVRADAIEVRRQRERLFLGVTPCQRLLMY